MNTGIADPTQTEACNSQAGKRLTAGQFEEAWGVAGIMNRHIHRAAVFKEKLSDYAHAFARTEKFDAQRADLIIRDVYQARYGEEMNQTRTKLVEREANMPEDYQARALFYARSIEPIIQDGETRPFYQAFDIAAVNMAIEFAITEAGAKRMMKDSFEQADGRDLYATGKAWEDTYHKPVREAERAIQKAGRQSRSRTGPQR